MLKLALKGYGKVRKLVTGNEGATLVEYALLVGLIAVVCIAAVELLGDGINAMFTAIGTKLSTVAGTI